MRIEHVALTVRDLEAAKAFFVRYFGAAANHGYHNPKTGLRTYFLAFDGGARLELMTRPQLTGGVEGSSPAGLAHVAFALGSREAVDALTARLAADGYAVESGPRVTGDGYYESCVRGPEGCLLELTA
jgi:lactoylglutathione lyase